MADLIFKMLHRVNPYITHDPLICLNWISWSAHIKFGFPHTSVFPLGVSWRQDEWSSGVVEVISVIVIQKWGFDDLWYSRAQGWYILYCQWLKFINFQVSNRLSITSESRHSDIQKWRMGICYSDWSQLCIYPHNSVHNRACRSIGIIDMHMG